MLTNRGPGGIIFSGGTGDMNRAGPLPIDIERIKGLYPAQPQPNFHQYAPPVPLWQLGNRSVAAKGPPAKRVTKRWHSIPFNQNVQPGQPKAWPSCNGYTLIFYCFENQASSDTLGDLFEEALDKWRPATDVSSLLFATDPACEQLPCICTTPGVAEETVHIKLGLVGEPNWSASTLGYRGPSIPNALPHLPRHFIHWPAAPVNFGDRDVVYMAQHLGE